MKNKYAREFNSLFAALCQDKTDSFLHMSYESFKNDVVFAFIFLLICLMVAGTIEHISPLVRGSLRLQIRFGSALEQAINIIAFCEFDSIVEISKEGIITIGVNGSA